MATSIGVNADVASLKKALGDIRNEANQTQAALNSGLGMDKAAAKAKQLQTSLTSLSQALDKVSEKSKLDLDVKDAVAAVDGLQKKVEGGFGGSRKPGGQANATRDEERLHRLRKSHALQEDALKRKITERQAQDAERAFKNYARANPHLRQFDSYADFLKRGKDQYGKDFSRVRSDAMRHVNQRAGIFSGADDKARNLGRVAGKFGGIAGGLIAGGGGMFGSMGGILGGAAGLLGGPVGMVAGAVLGPALGALGSKLDQAVQDVIEEGAKSSNLARAFGSSFSGVRDAHREAAHGMGIDYGESAQHAAMYARTAALRTPQGLFEGLQGGYGFGRALGVGQGSGASFMATMRGSGAAGDEKAARRIGLTVAEAIQKGGLGPQADEVLSAIENFAHISTQANFRAPDVGAFASMLSAGNNLKLSGLHAGGMASILQGVDSSIRQGGSFGTASETVSLNAIANLDPSMDAYGARRVLQGGAFGTIAGAYGENSAAVKEAQDRLSTAEGNGDTAGAATARADLEKYRRYASGANANVSNLDAQMRMFQGMGGDEAARAMGNHFGLSMDQASVLRATFAKAGSGGQLAQRLGSMGIDMGKVDMGSAMHMASVLDGGSDVLQETKQRLLKGDEFKALNQKQKDALNGARGDDELREVLLKTLSQVGGATSAAEKAQQAQLDMKNNMARLADGLIPLTTKMSDGINALVEKLAPNTEYGQRLKREREEAKAAEVEARRVQAKEKFDSPDGKPFVGYRTRVGLKGAMNMPRTTSSTGGASGGWDSPAPGGDAAQAIAPSIPGAAAAGQSPRDKRGRLLPSAASSRSKEALDYFMSKGWTKEQAAGIVSNLSAESKFDESASGDSGRAYGIAQWHPDRQREFAKFSGKGIVGSTYQEQLAFVQHELTQGNEKAAGDRLKQAKTAADAGSIVSQYYERPADRYGQAAARARDADSIYAAAIPEPPSATRAAAAGGGKLDANIKVTVVDSKGRPRDDVKAEVVSTNYQPMPAGT